MLCQTPNFATLQACPEEITLSAGLAPNTEYYWCLRTRTGKLYQRKASTDAQGKLVIDTAALPAGLLNPFAGHFTLEVRQGSNYLNRIPLVIDGKSYQEIQISFVEVDHPDSIAVAVNTIPAHA